MAASNHPEGIERLSNETWSHPTIPKGLNVYRMKHGRIQQSRRD
jgi:hypothetical protein